MGLRSCTPPLVSPNDSYTSLCWWQVEGRRQALHAGLREEARTLAGRRASLIVLFSRRWSEDYVWASEVLQAVVTLHHECTEMHYN